MVSFTHNSMTKRDDIDIPIGNFPYLNSNLPEFPAYSECDFMSQLIRYYARVCSTYGDFLFRGSLLVSKLLHNCVKLLHLLIPHADDSGC